MKNKTRLLQKKLTVNKADWVESLKSHVWIT